MQEDNVIMTRCISVSKAKNTSASKLLLVAKIRLLFALSYSGWTGAQSAHKKTKAAGTLGLFKYPKSQKKDESPSKNATLKKKKKVQLPLIILGLRRNSAKAMLI